MLFPLMSHFQHVFTFDVSVGRLITFLTTYDGYIYIFFFSTFLISFLDNIFSIALFFLICFKGLRLLSLLGLVNNIR